MSVRYINTTYLSLELFQQRLVAVNSLDNMDKITNLRCVAVGDRGVGKSSIFSIFTDNKLCKERLNYTTSAFVIIDGKPIRMILSDTIYLNDVTKKNHRSYLPADVVIICFSLVNLASLKTIKTKWYPLVRHIYPKTPIILVGTKLDLRNNLTRSTYQKGKSMAKKIKAVKYLECSALTRQGVQVVIEEAIKAALTAPANKRMKNNKLVCVII